MVFYWGAILSATPARKLEKRTVEYQNERWIAGRLAGIGRGPQKTSEKKSIETTDEFIINLRTSVRDLPHP